MYENYTKSISELDSEERWELREEIQKIEKLIVQAVSYEKEQPQKAIKTYKEIFEIIHQNPFTLFRYERILKYFTLFIDKLDEKEQIKYFYGEIEFLESLYDEKYKSLDEYESVIFHDYLSTYIESILESIKFFSSDKVKKKLRKRIMNILKKIFNHIKSKIWAIKYYDVLEYLSLQYWRHIGIAKEVLRVTKFLYYKNPVKWADEYDTRLLNIRVLYVIKNDVKREYKYVKESIDVFGIRKIMDLVNYAHLSYLIGKPLSDEYIEQQKELLKQQYGDEYIREIKDIYNSNVEIRLLYEDGEINNDKTDRLSYFKELFYEELNEK